MASIYQEGSGWAARVRKARHNVYQGGFATRRAAEQWARECERDIDRLGQPRGLGPARTSLAQALSDYAQQVLPFKKGAVQELVRLNKFLRAAQLPAWRAIPVDGATGANGGTHDGATRHFTLELIPAQTPRPVPKGLHAHRQKQAARSAGSDRIRQQLANRMVADLTPYQLQALVDQLRTEGYKAATIHLERALLREFFNHARRNWRWAQPAGNAASDLRLPQVENARDRVLSADEQVQLEAALADCTNPHVLPCIAFLIETAMRQSEAVVTATWGDIDWQRRVLNLSRAKAGARQVPLTLEAVDLLRQLPRRAPHERIFPLSLEALKAAWNRAVERAGLEDLKLHDLRHTAATRLALRLNGNIFLLQLCTGHKTLSQLQRYVNLKADDAVRALDATAPATSLAPIAPEPAGTDGALTTDSAAPSNVLSFTAARARRAA